MATIRLTITPQLRQTLDELHSYFPLLKDDEIVRLALSDLRMKSIQTYSSIRNVLTQDTMNKTEKKTEFAGLARSVFDLDNKSEDI